MNYDTIYHTLLKIDNIPDLRNFCKISLEHSKICKENVNTICKRMLEYYNVDYSDTNNFIYRYSEYNDDDSDSDSINTFD